MGIAICEGHTKVFQVLQKAGVELTKQPDWQASIFGACINNRQEILGLLIKEYNQVILGLKDCMVRCSLFTN